MMPGDAQFVRLSDGPRAGGWDEVASNLLSTQRSALPRSLSCACASCIHLEDWNGTSARGREAEAQTYDTGPTKVSARRYYHGPNTCQATVDGSRCSQPSIVP